MTGGVAVGGATQGVVTEGVVTEGGVTEGVATTAGTAAADVAGATDRVVRAPGDGEGADADTWGRWPTGGWPGDG